MYGKWFLGCLHSLSGLVQAATLDRLRQDNSIRIAYRRDGAFVDVADGGRRRRSHQRRSRRELLYVARADPPSPATLHAHVASALHPSNWRLLQRARRSLPVTVGCRSTCCIDAKWP